jgi:hypothetical protein
VNIDAAIQDAGIDLATLPAGVRESLRRDVAKAFSAGQRPNHATLSRMTDARTVGVDLTRGQATRDPGQCAFEQNTRGIANAGEPLARRFGEQNAQLVDQAGRGASANTPYQSGQAFTSALRSHDEAINQQVGSAYAAARTQANAGAEIPPQMLAQRAGEVLETYGPENVPAVVMRRLQSYGLLGGQQTKIFTVEEADRLRKVTSANFDSSKKAEAAALTSLRSGIAYGNSDPAFYGACALPGISGVRR